MPLEGESSTKYTVEPVKLEGGMAELRVGNPREPHPLYETLLGVVNRRN